VPEKTISIWPSQSLILIHKLIEILIIMKKIILILTLTFIFIQFADAQLSIVKSDVGFSDFANIASTSKIKRWQKRKSFKKQFYIGPGMVLGLVDNLFIDQKIRIGGQLNAIYFNRKRGAIDFSLDVVNYPYNETDSYYYDGSLYNTDYKSKDIFISFLTSRLFVFGKEKVRPYLGAGAGVCLELWTDEDTYYRLDPKNNQVLETSSYEMTERILYLSLSPSLGVFVELSDWVRLNFNARFSYRLQPVFMGWEYWQVNSSVSLLFKLSKS